MDRSAGLKNDTCENGIVSYSGGRVIQKGITHAFGDSN